MIPLTPFLVLKILLGQYFVLPVQILLGLYSCQKPVILLGPLFEPRLSTPTHFLAEYPPPWVLK